MNPFRHLHSGAIICILSPFPLFTYLVVKIGSGFALPSGKIAEVAEFGPIREFQGDAEAHLKAQAEKYARIQAEEMAAAKAAEQAAAARAQASGNTSSTGQ